MQNNMHKKKENVNFKINDEFCKIIMSINILLYLYLSILSTFVDITSFKLYFYSKSREQLLLCKELSLIFLCTIQDA